MPTVFIPALLQGMTGGKGVVEAAGTTVREVIADLDRRYPGLGGRLLEGDRLRLNISVAVDGEISPDGLSEAVGEESEVHFVAAIRGGRAGSGTGGSRKGGRE